MAIDSLGQATRSNATPLQQPERRKETRTPAEDAETFPESRETAAAAPAQAADSRPPVARENETPDSNAPRGSIVNQLV